MSFSGLPQQQFSVVDKSVEEKSSPKESVEEKSSPKESVEEKTSPRDPSSVFSKLSS